MRAVQAEPRAHRAFVWTSRPVVDVMLSAAVEKQLGLTGNDTKRANATLKAAMNHLIKLQQLHQMPGPLFCKKQVFERHVVEAYIYLDKICSSTLRQTFVSAKLKEAKCVYIKKHDCFVLPSEVFVEADNSCPPYWFKLEGAARGMDNLASTLGIASTLEASHYAQAMQKMKDLSNGPEFNMPAALDMIICLSNSADVLKEIEEDPRAKIFLPAANGYHN